MKVTLVHLSDIHFKGPTDLLCARAEGLAAAVRAADPESTEYLFLVSGDIAYSGKPSEYECAVLFFSSIKKELTSRTRTSVSCHFSFIPGNHDCDFATDSDTRRMAVAQMPSILGGLDVNGDLANKCLEVQEPFFKFVQELTGAQRSGEARLFDRDVFTLGATSIRVSCYNSAWMSLQKEVPGTLLFPIDQLLDVTSPKAGTEGSVIELAMIHHPYNWFSPNNGRRLRDQIESAADMVFTGHEHIQDQYLKETFCGE